MRGLAWPWRELECTQFLAEGDIVLEELTKINRSIQDGRTVENRAKKIASQQKSRPQDEKAETDLAGSVNKIAQAIADEKKKRDDNRNGTQDVK